MVEPARRVALVVKGYPRLSETFIAQEIFGLQEAGQRQVIVSLRRPYDDKTHPVHDKITAPVLYLPEYLEDEPDRVAKAEAAARKLPGFEAAHQAYREDLKRDPTANRDRRFGQACVLATELPKDVDWIYVHFLHTPASVGRYASLMTGIPWSVSAHAKDIYTSEDWELRQKLPGGDLGAAEWCATCTQANAHHLRARAGSPEDVHLVYHGLNSADLPQFEPSPQTRDGSDPLAPVRLISVGRAVAKKGFDLMLEALAALPQGLAWHWTHIGKGDDLQTLQAQADRLGLKDQILWMGAQSRAEVFDALKQADLFVLPSRILPDGDRDGLPNVLMEAAWFHVPALSTRLDGIGELVTDGETGVLVTPNSLPELAAALDGLIRDPTRRQALGDAVNRKLISEFDFHVGLATLKEKFGL